MEADITAIKEVLNQYAVGCCNGDFDLWMSLWTIDGTQMPPDAPALIGDEKIRDGMKPGFDQMNMELTILSIDDVKIYGDLGLTRCIYTLKMTPKKGGETINVMDPGKALTLYERQAEGNWKIVYDCFNSSIPANLV